MITIVCTQPTSVTNAKQFTGFLPFLLQGPQDSRHPQQSAHSSIFLVLHMFAVHCDEFPRDDFIQKYHVLWLCSLLIHSPSCKDPSFSTALGLLSWHIHMLLCMYTYILCNLPYIYIHIYTRIYVQICNVCLSLVSFTQYAYLQLFCFPSNDIIAFFFIVE